MLQCTPYSCKRECHPEKNSGHCLCVWERKRDYLSKLHNKFVPLSITICAIWFMPSNFRQYNDRIWAGEKNWNFVVFLSEVEIKYAQYQHYRRHTCHALQMTEYFPVRIVRILCILLAHLFCAIIISSLRLNASVSTEYNKYRSRSMTKVK